MPISLVPRTPGAATPLLTAWLLCSAAIPGRAQQVAEVQVTPETLTLGVGRHEQISVAAFDRQGNLLPAARFTFSASDPAVVRVTADGTVFGLRPGRAKVEARVRGRRASLPVVVTAAAGGVDATPTRTAALPAVAARAPATVLTLDPAAVKLLPGETAPLVPHALREDGSAAELGRVLWKSLRPEVAQVAADGIVTALTPGRSIVQAASAGTVMATALIEVEQAEVVLAPARLTLGPDETATLRVVVPSQGNRPLSGIIQWRSSDTMVVRVGPTGLVQAHSAGDAEIVATGFFPEQRASVHVHKLATVFVISPRPGVGALKLLLRGTLLFGARAVAADSTPVSEAGIAWDLSDSAVASFDAGTGTLTGRAIGTTRLVARLAGFEPAVWTVAVLSGNVGVEPARAGLTIGERMRVSARLLDEQNAPAPGVAEVKWTSSAPGVAAVGADGTVEALGPGHAVVSATTDWGKTAVSDVYVTGDLFLSSDRRGSFGVYQLRLAAPDQLLPIVADSSWSGIQPVLSPDRTRFVFASDRGGQYDLYLMDADGRNVRRLTTELGVDLDPVWTPDGTRIVFSSARSGSTQIYVMGADGAGARALTSSPGGNMSPTISPDGKRVAFVSARDGNYELYAADLDGGVAERLTTTPQRKGNPHFLPGGDLLYTVDRVDGAGSRIMRLSGDHAPLPLIQTDQHIGSIGVSRDGARVACVVGRILASGRTAWSLFVQPLAPGGVAVPVPLLPGERVLTPSF